MRARDFFGGRKMILGFLSGWPSGKSVPGGLIVRPPTSFWSPRIGLPLGQETNPSLTLQLVQGRQGLAAKGCCGERD